MEILELLPALVEGCGCLVEVVALGADVGAGLAGAKARKKRKEHRAAQEDRAARAEAGLPVPPEQPTDSSAAYKRSLWIFWILLVLGVVLTGMTLWKWLR